MKKLLIFLVIVVFSFGQVYTASPAHAGLFSFLFKSTPKVQKVGKATRFVSRVRKGGGSLSARSIRTTRATAAQLGKQGEMTASRVTGAGKNTQKFVVNGRVRIPDQVNALNIKTKKPLIVTEAKNVKYQSYTRQLKDNVALVGTGKGVKVNVVVRKDTQISRPLQKAHNDPKNPINVINVIGK